MDEKSVLWRVYRKTKKMRHKSVAVSLDYNRRLIAQKYSCLSLLGCCRHGGAVLAFLFCFRVIIFHVALFFIYPFIMLIGSSHWPLYGDGKGGGKVEGKVQEKTEKKTCCRPSSNHQKRDLLDSSSLFSSPWNSYSESVIDSLVYTAFDLLG